MYKRGTRVEVLADDINRKKLIFTIYLYEFIRNLFENNPFCAKNWWHLELIFGRCVSKYIFRFVKNLIIHTLN